MAPDEPRREPDLGSPAPEATPASGAPAPEAPESHEHLVRKSVTGARLLLIRGLVMRAVSVPTTLLMALLVAPEQLGLLAVVRGISGVCQFISDLGFESAMLRRRTETTDHEVAALAGFRMVILVVLVAGMIVLPGKFTGLHVIPANLQWWMYALLLSLLSTPFQAGSKIRLERQLEFKNLAYFDISRVTLENVGLLIAAAVGQFSRGLFIVLIIANLFNTIVLHRLAPGPKMSFRFGHLRSLWRDTAGYTVSTLLVSARDSVTPILIGRFFGLEIAGYWSFAQRFGQVLQLTFEGQARAAVPAAARLSGHPALLRRLSSNALRDGARLAWPAAAAVFACAPLLHTFWPKWGGAVEMVQWYIPTLAVAGVMWGSLSPVMNALRGSPASIVQYTCSVAVQWTTLVILWRLGYPNVAIGYTLGSLAAGCWLIYATGREFHPAWWDSLRRPTGVVATCALVYVVATLLGVSPLVRAITGTLAAALWMTPELRRAWALVVRRFGPVHQEGRIA